MRIRYHRDFQKRFERLSGNAREKVLAVIEQFQNDPRDPALYNHPLHGALSGKRSIKVTGSIRIIFYEWDDHAYVLMLDVGTHAQVYGE